jgi:hypothetical protein
VFDEIVVAGAGLTGAHEVEHASWLQVEDVPAEPSLLATLDRGEAAPYLSLNVLEPLYWRMTRVRERWQGNEAGLRQSGHDCDQFELAAGVAGLSRCARPPSGCASCRT